MEQVTIVCDGSSLGKMSYFFDRTFKIGAVIGVAVFAIINIISYFWAVQNYSTGATDHFPGVSFGPGPRFDWGFPTNWGVFPDEVFNAVAGICFAAVGGTVLQFFVRRRSSSQE